MAQRRDVVERGMTALDRAIAPLITSKDPSQDIDLGLHEEEQCVYGRREFLNNPCMIHALYFSIETEPRRKAFMELVRRLDEDESLAEFRNVKGHDGRRRQGYWNRFHQNRALYYMTDFALHYMESKSFNWVNPNGQQAAIFVHDAILVILWSSEITFIPHLYYVGGSWVFPKIFNQCMCNACPSMENRDPYKWALTNCLLYTSPSPRD